MIVGQGGKPVGIFTERSVLNVIVQGTSLDNHVVGDYTDPSFRLVSHCEPIANVWEAILRDGCRFICVIDADGHLIGLTGQRGLAEYVAEHFPQQIMVQRLEGKPWIHQREGA